MTHSPRLHYIFTISLFFYIICTSKLMIIGQQIQGPFGRDPYSKRNVVLDSNSIEKLVYEKAGTVWLAHSIQIHKRREYGGIDQSVLDLQRVFIELSQRTHTLGAIRLGRDVLWSARLEPLLSSGPAGAWAGHAVASLAQVASVRPAPGELRPNGQKDNATGGGICCNYHQKKGYMQELAEGNRCENHPNAPLITNLTISNLCSKCSPKKIML